MWGLCISNSFVADYHIGNKSNRGFTVIELIIVIAVLGILGSISYMSLNSTLPSSRDSNRDLDTSTIADKLELYYETTPVANGSTYPATSVGVSGLATIVDSQDSTVAPGQEANSLILATSNATQSPTTSQYIYQPLTRTGSLCTNATTALCARYVLYYRQEVTGSVNVINSLRQQ